MLCTCLFESPLSRLGGRAQEGCRLRRQPHGQPALSQGIRTAARAALWSFRLRSSLPLRTLTRGGAPATVSPRKGLSGSGWGAGGPLGSGWGAGAPSGLGWGAEHGKSSNT